MSYLDKIKVGSTTYDFHDTTIQEATQSVAGLMSASDKTKLDQINPQGLLYVDITVPLAIGSWTASGSNYEYSWTNALISNTAIIEVYLSDNARDGLVGDFTFVKVSGGLTFITNQAPVDNFTVIVRVIDSNVDGGIELLAENVETEAITGTTNVEEALTVLDGQDTTLNTKIENTKNEIAIVENGNTATHEITDKQFVIWKDALYKANGAIHFGATLSTSNLNAVSNGVANSLKQAVDDVNNKITNINKTLSPIDSDSIDGFLLGLKNAIYNNYSSGIFVISVDWLNRNTFLVQGMIISDIDMMFTAYTYTTDTMNYCVRIYNNTVYKYHI